MSVPLLLHRRPHPLIGKWKLRAASKVKEKEVGPCHSPSSRFTAISGDLAPIVVLWPLKSPGVIVGGGGVGHLPTLWGPSPQASLPSGWGYLGHPTALQAQHF